MARCWSYDNGLLCPFCKLYDDESYMHVISENKDEKIQEIMYECNDCHYRATFYPPIED